MGQERQRENLEKELQGLKDLLAVAQVVVSSLELDEVLQNILCSAMAVMDMPAGSIALYEEKKNELSLHAHAGLSDRFVAMERWGVRAGGLTARILREAELFTIEDIAETSVFRKPLVEEEGVRSLIAAPLKIQDEVLGILYLDDFVPRRFCEERLRLLSILVSFAAMSIDNARLHEKTQWLACTDSLTGLYNRRQFEKVLAAEMVRARRYSKPLSLIMFDVDDFKLFNDSYGHLAGDKALVTVAETLQECMRDCDKLFRFGGEEFTAVLPETGIEEALIAAERMRSAVEFTASLHIEGGRCPPVTVSVGVASFPRDCGDIDSLVKKVDDLLYMAKEAGKNRVQCISKAS